jgi:hypothetical protein
MNKIMSSIRNEWVQKGMHNGVCDGRNVILTKRRVSEFETKFIPSGEIIEKINDEWRLGESVNDQ